MADLDWHLNAFVLQCYAYTQQTAAQAEIDEIIVTLESRDSNSKNGKVLSRKSTLSKWESSTLVANRVTKQLWKETALEFVPCREEMFSSQHSTSSFELCFRLSLPQKLAERRFLTVEIVILLSVPTSGQVLYPIIVQPTSLARPNGPATTVLLAKVAIRKGKLYYLLPDLKSVTEKASLVTSSYSKSAVNFTNLFQVVEAKNVVAELNGARGGRPSHKITSELLITPEQGQKILEIRKRWEGLSARQRRVVVSAEDLYPFLTLNRDETAQLLGVCATWLKDTIRLHGMKTWPARPLRRSGAYLQSQKEVLKTLFAKLNYTPKHDNEFELLLLEIEKVQRTISECIVSRTDIVRQHVSKHYFENFLTKNGPSFLNPDWSVHPPERQLIEDE